MNELYTQCEDIHRRTCASSAAPKRGALRLVVGQGNDTNRDNTGFRDS